MAVKHFRELIVWQKAMDLVVAVYERTESFPQREIFGLTNQMRRAAVSVPSNIAEGQGRSTTDGFVHFLYVAKGSLQELETQVILSRRLQFLSEDDYTVLQSQLCEVARILNGLITSLT